MQLKGIFGFIISVILCVQFINGHKREENEINFKNNESSKSDKRKPPGHTGIDESLEKTYSSVSLVLINRQDSTQRHAFTLGETHRILQNPWFGPRLPTVVYAFGFMENMSNATVEAIIKGYVSRGIHNIIVIDWSAYNGKIPSDYQIALANMKSIGGLVGRRFYKTFSSWTIHRFHLVGFDLGAHMAAYINRAFPKSLLTTKIPRIIGLDPSGPLMYDWSLGHNPLNSSDAQVVQIIHTDLSVLGAPRSSGTIDFYPNGGGVNGIQPGCLTILTDDINNPLNWCSHQRSVFLYAESLTTATTDVFKAIQCANYVDFLFDKCGSDFDLMGYGSSDKYKGDFYLQTNSKAPFNRGISGIRYVFTAP